MKYWYYYTIGALLLIIVLMSTCNRAGPGEVISSETITTVDSIGQDTAHTSYNTTPMIVKMDTTFVYRWLMPRVQYRDTGSTRWRNYRVDTAAILKDYFAMIIYSDTLYADSNDVDIIINDSISSNRIIGREVLVKNLRIKSVITTNSTTNIVEQNKYKYFLGAHLNSSFDDLGFNIGMLTKTDQLFTISNNILARQPNLTIGAYFKLQFKW